jgi:hypothetical protein
MEKPLFLLKNLSNLDILLVKGQCVVRGEPANVHTQPVSHERIVAMPPITIGEIRAGEQMPELYRH